MTYLGDTGEISARYRPSGEIPAVRRPLSTATFVAPGSATGGQYGLFRWDMRPESGGPDAHFHKTFSEAFYILDGTVGLFNGDKWVDAKAGDYLYVPEGGVHAFHNTSDEAASMLILFAPGAPREKYFIELAEIAESGRKLTDEEWLELWARHDQYPA
jgi:mannose-6-phosphate isomerase-like protein (cupin superfamily)